MLVEKAKDIAYKAHKGQYDKAGKAYINHPIYIASKMKTNEEKIVALLHDVVEDTDLSLEDLIEEGFPEEIIDAIKAITKKPQEDYFEYIERVKNNPLAKKVKIEDLKHNMDTKRIPNLSDIDVNRVKKYKRALEILEEGENQI